MLCHLGYYCLQSTPTLGPHRIGDAHPIRGPGQPHHCNENNQPGRRLQSVLHFCLPPLPDATTSTTDPTPSKAIDIPRASKACQESVWCVGCLLPPASDVYRTPPPSRMSTISGPVTRPHQQYRSDAKAASTRYLSISCMGPRLPTLYPKIYAIRLRNNFANAAKIRGITHHASLAAANIFFLRSFFHMFVFYALQVMYTIKTL